MSVSVALQYRLMALACFAGMACMRICDAMLPALAADFGSPISDTSSVISTFAIAYGLMQLVYGPLGDRFGKPRVIAGGSLLAGAAAFCAVISPSLAWLATCRLFMGAGAAAIVPLTMAAITSRVSGEERQLALAGLLTYTVTGMMAGTWAGGAIADFVSWRAAFGFVGGVLVCSGLCLMLSTRGGERSSSNDSASAGARIRLVLSEPWARRVLAVTCAEGALVFGVMAFVPALLHGRFAVPPSVSGAVLAMYAVGGLAYSRAARLLLRRLSAQGMARTGGAVVCIAFLLLAFMPRWTWAIPACLLAGFGFYMLHNTLQACAAHMCDGAPGTAMSLFSCVLFIGQSVGVSAMAWTGTGDVAAVSIFAAGLMLLLLAGHFSASMGAKNRAMS